LATSRQSDDIARVIAGNIRGRFELFFFFAMRRQA
jgi:hypothetical protein